MIKIYLTRHGETEWNVERRMQGQKNSDLTQLGQKQAKWLSQQIQDVEFDCIYSSPLDRAYKTAEIISENRDNQIIKTDYLMEIDLGSKQGTKIEDWKVAHKEQHDNFWFNPSDFKTKDGEDFIAVTKRISDFLEQIVNKHENQTILIVAHGIILKAMFNVINNQGNIETFWEGPPIGQASLSIVNYDKNQFSVELLADVSHHKEGNKKGAWFVDEE